MRVTGQSKNKLSDSMTFSDQFRGASSKDTKLNLFNTYFNIL